MPLLRSKGVAALGVLLLSMLSACGSSPSTSAACARDNGGCAANATCAESGGGVSCACLPGFSGDGKTCADVDECAGGTAQCSPDATCTNTPGSFTCACKPGFNGDGMTCSDVDECADGTAQCSPDATCTNTPGSYTCACKAGFNGDGKTCTDVDECSTGASLCTVSRPCVNTPGSYTCGDCPSGYVNDGPTGCDPVQQCGDGHVDGTEQCDDGALVDGDGCSATCQVEPGWVCPTAGAKCIPQRCGDGIVAGSEQCDDGANVDGDGCSATCTVEPGFACVLEGSPPTSVCHATHCGDGIREGSEECDDGNLIPYDGCSPTCTLEPQCQSGSCASVCGDGLEVSGEQCDDGNAASGDGCSADCATEPGFACTDSDWSTTGSLQIPVLYRDMLYKNTTVPGPGHPDFEAFGGGLETGLVQSQLGSDGKPVWQSNGNPAQLTGAVDFCWWFHEGDCDGPGSTNAYDVPVYLDANGAPSTLTLQPVSSGVFQFSSTAFYPLDGLGWNSGANPQTDADCSGSPNHNFSFTTELHYPFTYSSSASPTVSFTGDDDMWIFINGHLAIDLGGVHGAANATVTLSAAQAASFGLSNGGTYSIDAFQAERHTCASDYTLKLSGFTHTVTRCSAICGDGLVVGGEVCDDGVNDGSYGGCEPGCAARGPYCGDGVVQSPNEQCDDGHNVTTYGGTQRVCGPGCRFAPYCGDGIVSNGEQCDEGPQNGAGACSATCTLQ